MIERRARARVAAIAVAALGLVRAVDANADASPPDGWRVSPVKPVTTPKGPAGRADDDFSEVFVKALPEARTRTTGKGDRPIDRAPKLAMFDGRGLPAPWKDGPKTEIRFAPPGAFGTIDYQNQRSMTFFAPLSLQERGVGASLPIDHENRASLSGRFSFVSLDPLPNGRLAFDSVTGVTTAGLSPVVSSWTHAEAVPLAGGRVFAFREDTTAGEVVRLITFTRISTLPAGRGSSGRDTALLFADDLEAMKVLGLPVKHSGDFTLVYDTSRGENEASAVLHVDVLRE